MRARARVRNRRLGRRRHRWPELEDHQVEGEEDRRQADQRAGARALGGEGSERDERDEQLDGLDSTAFVRKAESFTRSWGCAGSTWESISGPSAYSTNDSLKFRSAIFRCNVDLPTGAVVTQARFTVVDDDAGAGMAATPLTVMTPGATNLIDSTMEQNPIDSTNFTYFLSCNSASGNTGIYGATLTYQATGGDG